MLVSEITPPRSDERTVLRHIRAFMSDVEEVREGARPRATPRPSGLHFATWLTGPTAPATEVWQHFRRWVIRRGTVGVARVVTPLRAAVESVV